MGGVDLLDQLISNYRVKFRKKKCYFPFYTWSLSVAAINSWRVMNAVRKAQDPDYEQESFIDFSVSTTMAAKHGSMPKHSNMNLGVQEEASFGAEHLAVPIESEDGADVKRSFGFQPAKMGNFVYCSEKEVTNTRAVWMCDRCGVALHALLSVAVSTTTIVSWTQKVMKTRAIFLWNLLGISHIC